MVGFAHHVRGSDHLPRSSLGADNTNSARGDNNEFSNKTIFLVKGATLPGSQIGVINVPFRGRKLKVSGDRTFADWETTIFSDTDYRLRNAIEKWAEHVQNHNYALGHNQLQDGTGVGGNNGVTLVTWVPLLYVSSIVKVNS